MPAAVLKIMFLKLDPKSIILLGLDLQGPGQNPLKLIHSDRIKAYDIFS